jgi:hypothetical protein
MCQEWELTNVSLERFREYVQVGHAMSQPELGPFMSPPQVRSFVDNDPLAQTSTLYIIAGIPSLLSAVSPHHSKSGTRELVTQLLFWWYHERASSQPGSAWCSRTAVQTAWGVVLQQRTSAPKLLQRCSSVHNFTVQFRCQRVTCLMAIAMSYLDQMVVFPKSAELDMMMLTIFQEAKGRRKDSTTRILTK